MVLTKKFGKISGLAGYLIPYRMLFILFPAWACSVVDKLMIHGIYIFKAILLAVC